MRAPLTGLASVVGRTSAVTSSSPLAQAAHECEAEPAGCAEDEDHSARSLRSSSSRSTAFPLSAIARS